MSTGIITKHDISQMEIKEPFSIRVKEPCSTKNYTIKLWFQRIITLNEVSNQKCHRPLFIITMSILHVLMHLLTYININWRGQSFAYTLYDLCMFFVPCMRSTPDNIRIQIVSCDRWIKNGTCHYDDALKYICFSFLYPHQIWRLITVNLLHMGWLHLLSNLLIQIVQGIPLERKYGSIRVIIVYWLSCLGASLSFMLINRRVSATGASGSLYGLMLFLIVDRLIAMQTDTERRSFIIIQLVFLLLPHIISSIPLIVKYNVAHSAHFGGGMVGFLLAVGMIDCPWPWNNGDCICRRGCRRAAFVFLILYYLLTFGIFFQIKAPAIGPILDPSYTVEQSNRNTQ